MVVVVMMMVVRRRGEGGGAGANGGADALGEVLREHRGWLPRLVLAEGG